jgi:hypothetical protein
MSLRLLKVVVQPVFVWDDGDTLREVQVDPVQVAPADWPDYPAKLAEQTAEQEAILAEQYGA